MDRRPSMELIRDERPGRDSPLVEKPRIPPAQDMLHAAFEAVEWYCNTPTAYSFKVFRDPHGKVRILRETLD
jgi:hypothetical protein